MMVGEIQLTHMQNIANKHTGVEVLRVIYGEHRLEDALETHDTYSFSFKVIVQIEGETLDYYVPFIHSDKYAELIFLEFEEWLDGVVFNFIKVKRYYL